MAKIKVKEYRFLSIIAAFLSRVVPSTGKVEPFVQSAQTNTQTHVSLIANDLPSCYRKHHHHHHRRIVQ